MPNIQNPIQDCNHPTQQNQADTQALVLTYLQRICSTSNFTFKSNLEIRRDLYYISKTSLSIAIKMLLVEGLIMCEYPANKSKSFGRRRRKIIIN